MQVVINWTCASSPHLCIARLCGVNGNAGSRVPISSISIGTQSTDSRDIRLETNLATERVLHIGGWMGITDWRSARLPQYRRGIGIYRGLRQTPYRSRSLHTELLRVSQSRIEDHYGHGNASQVGWAGTRHSQYESWPPEGRPLHLHTRCPSQPQCGRVMGGEWRFD